LNLFRDKVAIVTGGASGIGRALCEGLARRDAVVVVADVNEEGAGCVAGSINKEGGKASAAKLDVTMADDVKGLVEQENEKYGRLDFMFNNAGIAITGEMRDMDLEQWRRIVEVNLMGVVHGTMAAYSVMLHHGSGHIVNTASMAGFLPVPTETAYCTTKFGIMGLSNALRLEAADLGIRVSVVCPGFVETGIFEAGTVLKADMKTLKETIPVKLMHADDAARVILRGVVRNKAVITLPWYARPYWWLYRLHPAILRPWGLKAIRDFRKLKNVS